MTWDVLNASLLLTPLFSALPDVVRASGSAAAVAVDPLPVSSDVDVAEAAFVEAEGAPPFLPDVAEAEGMPPPLPDVADVADAAGGARVSGKRSGVSRRARSSAWVFQGTSAAVAAAAAAAVPVVEQRVRGRPPGSGAAATLTRDMLSKCFHLPEDKACKELNVGLTVLKRQCRRLGIMRWPFRKIKSLDRLISNVQTTGAPFAGASKVSLKSVDELRAQKKAMETCRVLDLDDNTKRLQQAYSKANHKTMRAVAATVAAMSAPISEEEEADEEEADEEEADEEEAEADEEEADDDEEEEEEEVAALGKRERKPSSRILFDAGQPSSDREREAALGLIRVRDGSTLTDAAHSLTHGATMEIIEGGARVRVTVPGSASVILSRRQLFRLADIANAYRARIHATTTFVQGERRV